MGFEKTQIFNENPFGLANDYTENCQFGAKTTETQYFLIVTSIL
jgi:hypothetical protein